MGGLTFLRLASCHRNLASLLHCKREALCGRVTSLTLLRLASCHRNLSSEGGLRHAASRATLRFSSCHVATFRHSCTKYHEATSRECHELCLPSAIVALELIEPNLG